MTELFRDRCAVVTGAGSGVGRATAERLADSGACVVCADIDLDQAKETVRLIESRGGTGMAVEVDVSREDDVEGMIDAAVEQYDHLDVLVNNVGIPTPRLGTLLEDHTAEEFHRLVSVNLGGVFFGCKHAVRRFKKQGSGGSIVNTASVAGMVAWGGSVYGATKGAVLQLTRALAIEGAPHDIRVNAICPSGMPATGFMVAGGMDPDTSAGPEFSARVAAQHPLGRAVTAEDCAEAILFLASDRARNITGVSVPVDGGYIAR